VRTLRVGKWIGACLILSVVFVVGYATAIMSLREELLIDYDSGDLRRRVLVGPIVVRDDRPRSTLFQECVGSLGITGKSDWRTALVSWGPIHESASYDGGRFLNETARLGIWFPSVGTHEAAKVKQGLLVALSKGGLDGAVEYSKKMEVHLLSLVEKQESK